jgi:DNA excision repair protein ERCC-3
MDFIQEESMRFGNAKLVLKQGKYFIESQHVETLTSLLLCPSIKASRVNHIGLEEDEFLVRSDHTSSKSDDVVSILDVGCSINSMVDDELVDQESILSTNRSSIFAFEILGKNIESIKKEAQDSGNPLLEEYEFYNCELPKLKCFLKSTSSVRPYQEKALRKIFGNGRARSGTIVLPCGSGKTAVGVIAASTVRRSCIVLCTGVVAVEQWRNHFRVWTDLADSDIKCFTSNQKGILQLPLDRAFVLITTYSMLGSAKRSDANESIMQKIRSLEWGLVCQLP